MQAGMNWAGGMRAWFYGGSGKVRGDATRRRANVGRTAREGLRFPTRPHMELTLRAAAGRNLRGMSWFL